MIISASRRTDIPGYFGKKFYDDLKNGKFEIVNPFNNKKSIVSFKKSDIDGIVFWTKNPLPFFDIIKKIKSEGYNFYFQYTLNNYPYEIEPLKFNFKERLQHLKELSEIIYPNKIFLRYDPIILTKKLSMNFHIENFEKIVEEAKDYADRITISFITLYKKIKKFFPDIIQDKEIERKILLKFGKISLKNNLKTYICCYPENTAKFNIFPGKCVDGSIFGLKEPKKHIGQRKYCNCDKSIDIGYYRTCKTKCLYCYAS